MAVLSVGSLHSCTKSAREAVNQKVIRFNAVSKPVPTVSVGLPWNGTALPTRIKKLGDYLFITDLRNPDAMVSIWSIERQQQVRAIIPKGDGPFELSAVSSIFSGDGETIFFYDLQTLRVLQANLDSLAADTNYRPIFKKRITSNDFEHANRIQAVTDTTFLAMTLPALHGRFHFLDQQLNYQPHPLGGFPALQRTGELERMTDISFQAKVLGNLFAASIEVDRGRGKLIVAYNNVDMIDIYDLPQKSPEVRLIGPDQNYPTRYRLNSQGQALPCAICNAGYKSPQATENYFAALRLHKRYVDLDSYQSKMIFFFSWEGELIRVLELDYDIADFVIDQQRKAIFFIAMDADQPLRMFGWAGF